jgi:hypothetical protein
VFIVVAGCKDLAVSGPPVFVQAVIHLRSITALHFTQRGSPAEFITPVSALVRSASENIMLCLQGRGHEFLTALFDGGFWASVAASSSIGQNLARQLLNNFVEHDTRRAIIVEVQVYCHRVD